MVFFSFSCSFWIQFILFAANFFFLLLLIMARKKMKKIFGLVLHHINEIISRSNYEKIKFFFCNSPNPLLFIIDCVLCVNEIFLFIFLYAHFLLFQFHNEQMVMKKNKCGKLTNLAGQKWEMIFFSLSNLYYWMIEI